MVIAAYVAVVLAATTAAAGAESGIPIGSGPGGVPFGAGTQRGLQSMNNSGQNGFVTLFDRGMRTAVVVAIEGAGSRRERVSFQRGTTCDRIGTTTAARLNDLAHGSSRGYAPLTMRRLLSGNYLTVVYNSTSPKAFPVACGELFR
jgi:hypothetical protein